MDIPFPRPVRFDPAQPEAGGWRSEGGYQTAVRTWEQLQKINGHRPVPTAEVEQAAKQAAPVTEQAAKQAAPLSSKQHACLLELKQAAHLLARDAKQAVEQARISPPVLGFRLLLATESKQAAEQAASKQSKGGAARAAHLTPERRKEIAVKAATARYAKRNA